MRKTIKVRVKSDSDKTIKPNTKFNPSYELDSDGNIIVDGKKYYSESNVNNMINNHLDSHTHLVDIINEKWPGLLNETEKYVPVHQVDEMCKECSHRKSNQSNLTSSHSEVKETTKSVSEKCDKTGNAEYKDQFDDIYSKIIDILNDKSQFVSLNGLPIRIEQKPFGIFLNELRSNHNSYR